MLVKFLDAQEIKLDEGIVWDYGVGNETGISYQKLTSRGPKRGYYLNKVCREIYFIISGEARFHVGPKVYDVVARDLIYVESNVAHSIETEGLEYITITNPDWYEEQAKIVDEISK